MGSLIEYLKKKTAVSVLEKSVKHAQKVKESVIELDLGVEILLKEKNFEKAHDHFHKVDLLEDDADTLRREIQIDISKGELNPSVRMDLAHLIKRMDDVANCATGVARRINTIPIKFWEQSSETTINLVIQMMKTTVECVNYLDKIVIDLLEERTKVIEYAEKINQLEHKIDLFNIKLRKNLQETDYEVNYFTAFTAGNVFDILEAISDAIEVVADYITQMLTGTKIL